MRRLFALFFAFLFACTVSASAQEHDAKPPKQTVYDFSLVDLDGKVVSLSAYKGKVLLVVNLASQSVYNGQIAALNDLQKTYSAQGLVVLGIPSSDFGSEELKDLAAVRKYYIDTAKVGFPVFAPAKTTGVGSIPLYHFLTDPKLGPPGGELHWNFTKFLIDRSGKPLARYEVSEDPADADFHVLIEKALAGKFKKSGGGDKGAPAGGGDDDDDDGL